MIQRSIIDDITWIDLLNPTAEEIQEVAKTYSLSQRVVEDLATPTIRHTVECESGHAYLVLHFPAFGESEDSAFEVDFVIGRDFLITGRYQESGAIESFRAAPSAPPFFGLINILLQDIDHKLSKIDHWVRDVEKNMFAGKEKQTIFELSEASRHLVDMKKIIAVYPDSLKDLCDKGRDVLGAEGEERLKEVLETFERASAKLELLSTSVHELRETNASILSTKQNETMKVLTGVTVAATIIVGIALIVLGYLALK